MNSACDFPLHDLNPGEPGLAVLEDSQEQSAVNLLVAQLQGFRIDLFGDRYAPYEVIFRNTTEDFPETSRPSRERERAQRSTELATRLAVVLDQQIDRKLVTSSYDWPGPDVEPIRLPECMLFNALKLAAVLSMPAILAKPVKALYQREQSQPLLPSEIRSALLDAILTNQKENDFLQLWEEIFQTGHSANGYFIASPQFGKRGLLRASKEKLKFSFKKLLGEALNEIKEASRLTLDVANAILWYAISAVPSMKHKAITRSLIKELAPNCGPHEVYLLVQLANLAEWPEWMCRQIRSSTRLDKTRFLLKEEVFVCMPEKKHVYAEEHLCNGSFRIVVLDKRCDVARLESQVKVIAEEFQEITNRNLNVSESAELGDIGDWLTGKCTEVADNKPIVDLRKKRIKYWKEKV